MKLLLDTPGMGRLTLSHERTDHGTRRAYYIASVPARAVVVFRNGLEASKMPGDVVEVSVTAAAAPSGLARPGNAGKPHDHCRIAASRYSG